MPDAAELDGRPTQSPLDRYQLRLLGAVEALRRWLLTAVVGGLGECDVRPLQGAAMDVQSEAGMLLSAFPSQDAFRVLSSLVVAVICSSKRARRMVP